MTQGDAAALLVRDVSVSYKRRKVLESLHFDVQRGQIFGLLGLNGAGKTTLIKTILGLRRQDEGTLEVFGYPAAAGTARNRIAYIPERFDPPPFLTGMEFLRFSLMLYRERLQRDKINQAAETLMLDPAVLKNRVQTYSKGMRQKLGLLSVLLGSCELLILDEPMSGLDPRARALVKEAILGVKAQGRTVFLCTHILSDVAEICDEVCVLHDKSIIYSGAPAGLCSRGGSDNIERAFLNVIDGKTAAPTGVSFVS